MRLLPKLRILALIIHIASPLVFIWSLNTLFNTGIPFSFKTWFAGIALIYVVRYHLRPKDGYNYVHFDDEDDYDEDEDDDDDVYVDINKDKAKAEHPGTIPDSLKPYLKERQDNEMKDGKGRTK